MATLQSGLRIVNIAGEMEIDGKIIKRCDFCDRWHYVGFQIHICPEKKIIVLDGEFKEANRVHHEIDKLVHKEYMHQKARRHGIT